MSKEIKRESICWVPICPNQYSPDKHYYHLPPINTIRREIWLAMATKTTKDVNVEDILFCEDHFEVASDQVIIINNTTYKLNEGSIPSKNMPDQVCRMCNLLINNCTLVNKYREQFFTMSSVLTSQIPTSIQVELNYYVEEAEVSLRHVLQFCFKEFDIPTDIIPILCSNCFHNLWLFYTFKKRAMEVETCLEDVDSLPENYGLLALCRTCPEQCYNFFQPERDSEMDVMLQNMFANNYSTEVVPLRVCLNCNNVVKKICDFHKKCINAKKIVEKRAILNEKFKSKTSLNVSSSTQRNQLYKEELVRKNEEELTPLKLFNLIKEYKNVKGDNTDILAFQDLSPEFIGMLRVNGWDQNILMLKKLWNKMKHSKLINKNNTLYAVNSGEVDGTQSHVNQEVPPEETNNSAKINASVSTTVTKNNPSLSLNKKSNRKSKDLPRGVGRSLAATYAKKMWLAKVMRIEFNKSTAEDRRNRGFWQILLKRITQKYPTKDFSKLVSLWSRIKTSAKTHKVDGTCPIDAIVWKMVEKIQNETDKKSLNRKSSNKTIPARKKSVEDELDQTHPPKKIKMNGNEPLDTAGPSSSSTVCEELDREKRELFLVIKSSYWEIKKDIDVGDDFLWSKVLQRAYANGYDTLPMEKAYVVWANLRNLCNSVLSMDNQQPLIVEINQFLQRVKNNSNEPQTTIPVKKKSSQLKKQGDENKNGIPRKKGELNKKCKEQKKSHTWSNEEKENLISVIHQRVEYLSLKGAWDIIHSICKSNGCQRTVEGLRQYWQNMRKSVEKKIAEKATLTDSEKKIEIIINRLNKQSVDKSESISNGEERTFQKLQIINKPKKEDVETNDYDYVSLADIQMSMNMSDSKPVKKDDVDASLEQPTNLEIENEDSNDTVLIEEYVGARDLDLASFQM